MTDGSSGGKARSSVLLWAKIPFSVIEDERLSPAALGFLARLLHYASFRTGEACVGVRRLCVTGKRISLGTATALSAMLEAAEIYQVQRRSGGVNRYRLAPVFSGPNTHPSGPNGERSAGRTIRAPLLNERQPTISPSRASRMKDETFDRFKAAEGRDPKNEAEMWNWKADEDGRGPRGSGLARAGGSARTGTGARP